MEAIHFFWHGAESRPASEDHFTALCQVNARSAIAAQKKNDRGTGGHSFNIREEWPASRQRGMHDRHLLYSDPRPYGFATTAFCANG